MSAWQAYVTFIELYATLSSGDICSSSDIPRQWTDRCFGCHVTCLAHRPAGPDPVARLTWADRGGTSSADRRARL